MVNFYIVTNTNREEPEVVQQSTYIHIKCKTDASQTVICSEETITGADVVSKTQAQAQKILDDWIDEENVAPPLDAEGNQILQRKINLEAFLQ